MPQMRGNKFLIHFHSILRMEMLEMFKSCFSGTMVTISKVCFLILNPHTQLTTSLITPVSHSNRYFVDDQEIKIILVIKPLNLVIFKFIELVIFNLIW